jgi:folate-dependent phosphoribosylglycinamide formyltransferase PurN
VQSKKFRKTPNSSNDKKAFQDELVKHIEPLKLEIVLLVGFSVACSTHQKSRQKMNFVGPLNDI